MFDSKWEWMPLRVTWGLQGTRVWGRGEKGRAVGALGWAHTPHRALSFQILRRTGARMVPFCLADLREGVCAFGTHSSVTVQAQLIKGLSRDAQLGS